MIKKYRLKIPDMIPVDLCHLAWVLQPKVKIDSYWLDRDYNFSDIPKEWLEEVKDGPMTAREWAISIYGNDDSVHHRRFTPDEILEAFKQGEANNKLRHRETLSFEDWFDVFQQGTKHMSGENAPRYAAMCAWNACKKSHGL